MSRVVAETCTDVQVAAEEEVEVKAAAASEVTTKVTADYTKKLTPGQV